ncbi:MAG: hypothetical protein AAGE80_10120 [Pseudomonadota bacterium]
MRQLGAAAVILLLGAFGSSGAAASSDELDTSVRHGLALALFEQACIAKAPDFTATPEVFIAMGLVRPEDKATYRNNEVGLYGGIIPLNSGGIAGRQCSVLLKDGVLPILVVGLRETLEQISVPDTLLETPPTVADDPVLWDFRLPKIGLVSVTAGMHESGIAMIGMQVAERTGVTGR